jgi:two-component system sensor histidine kinase BaeS
MIRLTIQRKVFLATLVLAATLVVLLAAVMRWNLGQGFEKYTTEAEFARLEWLIGNVEAAYAEHGNWEFVRADPERVWRRLWRRAAEPATNPPFGQDRGEPRQDFPPRQPWQAENDRPRPPPQEGRPPPINDALRIGARLSLLDADGRWLAGNPGGKDPGSRRPIRYQGAVVGHIALEAAPASVRELDAAFLASQTRNLVIAGLAALVLSLLAAWLVARHLLGPIRDLGAGVRRIADGRLDAHIPVRADDELGELAQTFNEMAARLAAAEESRRAWISDASHELRTPLAVLRAEIEALQDGVRTPDAATLARLHKQVQQLAALVDDLRLTLTHAQDEGSMDRLPVAPLEVLDETVAAFRERFAAAGIGLEVAGTRDPGWQVRGDAGRLTQVFTNLLENTLRYTDGGGRLRIFLGVRGRRLVLQFDDTAPAPPRTALPHLFERFFRTEPSRSRASGGSGLGLAICKAIVEAHGGSIGANLSELGGLCIRIELPLEKA